MGLMAKDSGGGDFKRVPPGVYVARCIGLIDLGTQEVEFQGDKKLQHKALVKWEVFGEEDDGTPLTVEVNGVQVPLTVSKRYTMSLSTKARLRADLAAWRGRDFTQEELKSFDVSKLLGAYCMLNVQQNETNGKTYTNVQSITPVPKGLPKPAGVHPTVRFDLDEPDVAVYESFHEKLQETIAASAEWKAMHSPREGGSKPTTKPVTGTGFDDMDDDIPF
jgi:hypothetical protein